MKAGLLLSSILSLALAGTALAQAPNMGLVPMKEPYVDPKAIALYPGVAPGIVIRQSPQAGFQITPGEPISLEVSR